MLFVAFCSFFHAASLFSTGVDNEKVLELRNSTIFQRGRQWKSSRAGQQNIFFIFQPDFNLEISPKNATKHLVTQWHGHAHGLRTPREERTFIARPKIQSQSQIVKYGGSIFCLPHRPIFSDIFDLCLHWVSVVRGHAKHSGLNSIFCCLKMNQFWKC
jgi:hypothetical protein